MKIGVITFHWATNYGAVLQAYALFDYLESKGHQVEIINYKPSRYDWMPFRIVLSNPSQLLPQIKLYQREQLINRFRRKFLKMTKRYKTADELKRLADSYDVIISGSDQVLNPSFTKGGEGKQTDAYYIGFSGVKTKKIGYAVSFGCRDYPEDAFIFAKEWIHNFDAIGVRELSGIDILKAFRYKQYYSVVPDPTLLCGKSMFEKLQLTSMNDNPGVCVYVLGDITVDLPNYKHITFIDEAHTSINMEQWLCCIRDAEFFITNSYHGMLMALLFHTPFAVIMNKKSAGQNDRLATVLEKLGLLCRMINNDATQIASIKDVVVDWVEVDERIASFRREGEAFLNRYLS